MCSTRGCLLRRNTDPQRISNEFERSIRTKSLCGSHQKWVAWKKVRICLFAWILNSLKFIVWAWKFDDDIQEENPGAFKFLQMARAWKASSGKGAGPSSAAPVTDRMDADESDEDEDEGETAAQQNGANTPSDEEDE